MMVEYKCLRESIFLQIFEVSFFFYLFRRKSSHKIQTQNDNTALTDSQIAIHEITEDDLIGVLDIYTHGT